MVKFDRKIKLEKIRQQIKNCISLEDYEIPKAIVFFENFIQTYSGKIKRKSVNYSSQKNTEKTFF